MDSDVPSLAGLPQAKEWFTHFALWLPAQHKPTTLRADRAGRYARRAL
ncbi:hypothetical protein AB4305_03445 [Nocardia sp. 2YAB30]